jgi:hypothetical protein
VPRKLVEAHKDAAGTYWVIPADAKDTAPIEVWWKREHTKSKKLADENLVIRQDDGEEADAIILTLGQVYDLIAVLNCAVEEV